MDNNRKKYPENGLEEDVIYARKIHKYLDKPRIAKLAKKQMNKRFRKNSKYNFENEI